MPKLMHECAGYLLHSASRISEGDDEVRSGMSTRKAAVGCPAESVTEQSVVEDCASLRQAEALHLDGIKRVPFIFSVVCVERSQFLLERCLTGPRVRAPGFAGNGIHDAIGAVINVKID